MAGYGQFCPIAMACETLAERWTLLVVRELLRGSAHFNELRRGLPLMSPSLLSKRLRTLERAGVVERVAQDGGRGSAYRLTPSGEALRPVLDAIGGWGHRFSRGILDPRNLDASLLMWDIRRSVRPETCPAERTVVLFHLTGSRDGRSHFWLILDADGPELCISDPGFDIDLYVEGHVADLVRYWLGELEIDHLVRTGDLEITGRRSLRQAFPTWFRRPVLPGPAAGSRRG